MQVSLLQLQLLMKALFFGERARCVLRLDSSSSTMQSNRRLVRHTNMHTLLLLLLLPG
jgi:hypothetical protein